MRTLEIGNITGFSEYCTGQAQHIEVTFDDGSMVITTHISMGIRQSIVIVRDACESMGKCMMGHFENDTTHLDAERIDTAKDAAKGQYNTIHSNKGQYNAIQYRLLE